jgi:hypothetical protein
MTKIKLTGLEIETETSDGAVMHVAAELISVVAGMVRLPMAASAAAGPPAMEVRTPQRSKAIQRNDASPVATHKAADSRPRRRRLVLVCRERAGEFDVAQAAEMAGVKTGTVHSAMDYARRQGREWAAIGALHFKRQAAGNGSLGEARPRERDTEAMPVNAHVLGRAAPIRHEELPTPQEIDASGF